MCWCQDWIYTQLCHCTTPIHPLIPPLIEAFVNSIIVPSAKTDRTNEPITEKEIRAVFEEEEPMEAEGKGQRSKFTAQILMMYYTLLYQDTLLNNMKQIGEWKLVGRDVRCCTFYMCHSCNTLKHME